MSYDTKCWELAVAFVHDVDYPLKTRKELADELAQVIQDAIEDWMGAQKPKPRNPWADQSCQLNSEDDSEK